MTDTLNKFIHRCLFVSLSWSQKSRRILTVMHRIWKVLSLETKCIMLGIKPSDTTYGAIKKVA